METIEAKTKKWGNSLGIVIPKEIVKKEKIREGQKVKVLLVKDRGLLKETFGMMKGKWKEPTQKMKDKLRKELYND